MRILVFEFHQETNTFNPLPTSFRRFQPDGIFEGDRVYEQTVKTGGTVAGAVAAITEAGGEVIPAFFMHSSSGGPVEDRVYAHTLERLKHYLTTCRYDGVYAALHGATCTEHVDDACGTLLELVRSLAGDKVIAASFDLHANITEKVLKNADIICGYNTYPHVDLYQTGYRAAAFCMERLQGKKQHMAAAAVPVLLPPAGYTDKTGPFSRLIQKGKEMVEAGQIRDFTVFPVQPWLDIDPIESRIVTLGDDPDMAKACADVLARELFAIRESVQPPLVPVNEIIAIAEGNRTGKPVILADSADSPNGGCVGDSPVVAMRLQALESRLRTCMLVVDPQAVEQAFALGVGGTGDFSVGAGFTKGMPGPFRGQGTVRSLHDGYFRLDKHTEKYLGAAAVVRFGNMDILLCRQGSSTGNPMIYRSFGMEPLHYDLVVVKANTSFRAHYSAISDLIYVADTPGAGASNLRRMPFERLPKGRYPFDLPEAYTLTPADLW